MKKLLGIGLSLSLAMTLSACGNNNTTNFGDDADTGQTTTLEVAGETADETTAENTTRVDNDDADDKDTAVSETTNEVTNNNHESSVKFIGLVGIEKKALELVGADGIVTKIDLDRENNVYVYEVDVETPRTEHEIVLNATTAELIKHEKDGSDDYNEYKVKAEGAMSIEEAVKVIKEKSEFNNPFIYSISLDEDDNIVKYEAELYSEGKDYDLDIDAKSGDVLKFEIDDDDDHDDGFFKNLFD